MLFLHFGLPCDGEALAMAASLPFLGLISLRVRAWIAAWKRRRAARVG